MLHSLAQKLAQFFIQSGAVASEDEDIYVYGWEMILATGSGFLTMFILSLFIGEAFGTILFILSLFFLRIYSGGYHAGSFLGCYLVTTGIYVVTALLISLIPEPIILPTAVIMLLISAVIIFLRAPQEHPNRPLQEGEEEIFRKKTRLTTIIELALAAVFIFLMPSFTRSALWISFPMTITAILLLVPAKKHTA